MKKIVDRFVFYCFLLFSIISFVLVTFGQKPKECSIEGLQRAKFKVAFTSAGEVFSLRIIIKPKYQTDENLILLAKNLKQIYCKEKVIFATVFDNKKDARDFTVYEVKLIPDTLRAIYNLNRDKEKEYLVRIKLINNKQSETPIKLD